MSVQYKSSDGWKNISSSSNNAVDTVENGNMNPVTSNAVYDKFASIAAVDSVTNGNMHPVTSNAVYDALPNKSTSTSIQMTMRNNSENISGTPVNTTLIKLGSNWGIVIGVPNVSATTEGTISCAVSIIGATLIRELSINAWQNGIVSSFLYYNASISDFYIAGCQGNNSISARIVALVSW